MISDVQEDQAMIASIGGRAQRLQDSVALFVAIGGGWWNAKGEKSGRLSESWTIGSGSIDRPGASGK
jgi:hypothetical protein